MSDRKLFFRDEIENLAEKKEESLILNADANSENYDDIILFLDNIKQQAIEFENKSDVVLKKMEEFKLNTFQEDRNHFRENFKQIKKLNASTIEEIRKHQLEKHITEQQLANIELKIEKTMREKRRAIEEKRQQAEEKFATGMINILGELTNLIGGIVSDSAGGNSESPGGLIGSVIDSIEGSAGGSNDSFGQSPGIIITNVKH
jgi:hypothetical protein